MDIYIIGDEKTIDTRLEKDNPDGRFSIIISVHPDLMIRIEALEATIDSLDEKIKSLEDSKDYPGRWEIQKDE